MTNPPTTMKITIDIEAGFAVDVLTHDIERYDEYQMPDDGWTIESDVKAQLVETMQTLVDDLVSDMRATYDDVDLRERMQQAVQALEVAAE